jgi:hypothetical protein
MARESVSEVNLSRDMAQNAFDALGGVTQPLEDGCLEVVLPDSFRSYFQGLDSFCLRFSPSRESASSPAREPFLVGSPMLEGLIKLLCQKGRLARVFLNPPNHEIHNLDRKFAGKFHFPDATWSLGHHHPEETANVLFHFKVSFLTDDTTERLYPVVINLSTRLENEKLISRWNLFLDHQRLYSKVPFFHLPELGPAYAIAQERLREKAALDLSAIRQTQEKFLRRDLTRIQEYYRGLFVELQKRQGRVGVNPQLLDKIKGRKKAFDLDLQRKIVDAQEKYRIDVEAKLVNAAVVYQPWERVVLRIKTRREEMERTFYWDPVVKDFTDAACEGCQNPSDTFYVEAQKLLCLVCKKTGGK